MNNKKFDVYFDLGSSKIRAVAFDKDEIKNNFFYENNCISNFVINNSNYSNLAKEIEKVIFDLEKKTKEYLDNVNLMIDSREIFSVSLSLSKNFDGSELKKEDVQFMIRDAKQQILRNYSKQDIIHIIVNNYKVDQVDYRFLPKGIDCSMLSIDIIFICLPIETVQALKKIFSNLNILVNQFSVSSYAKSISYKENFNLSENIIFIDIGYDKSSIICYKNNIISFFNILPVGGNHITKDLAKILDINLIEAEEIKLSFDKDDGILDNKKISLDLVQKIIFARIEEILILCTKSIQLNETSKEITQFKLVLMGEGSKILDTKFKEKISFSKEIDLLEETTIGICESGMKLSRGANKQEVVVIPKMQVKTGFFEKLFHFFK